MLIDYQLGQTSIILRVKILDSSVSTGAGKTGLTNASSGLVIAAIADNESATTSYTSGGSTIQTIATLGTFAAPSANNCRFKELDSTNHKGCYEIQLDNTRYAVSNAKSLLVSISGATNAAETDVVIPLRSVNPYDGVHGGMSALPNTPCTSNASLITSGSGTDQLTVSGGLGSADAKKINAVSTGSVTAVNANVGTTQPTNFTGTGASAKVQADVITIGGTTQTAGDVVNSASTAVTQTTAANLAAGVLNAVAASYNTAGSIGNKINASGGAADPWATALPGSYSSGQAGAIVGGLAGSNVTIISPVSLNGSLTIVRGDDYKATDGRALDFVNAAGTWPTLTSATIKLSATLKDGTPVMGPITGSVIVASGPNQKVRIELTNAQTAIAPNTLNTPYVFDVQATLSDGSVVTLQIGAMYVLQDATP